MLTEDYVASVRRAAEAQAHEARVASNRTAGPSSSELGSSVQVQVAELFCARVLPLHTDVSIAHDRLAQLLSQQARPAAAAARSAALPAQQQQQHKLPALDQQVSLLMQMGVLSRHVGDTRVYVIGVPGLGVVVKAVTAGRQELQAMLKRRKYQEVREGVGKKPLSESTHIFLTGSMGEGEGRGPDDEWGDAPFVCRRSQKASCSSASSGGPRWAFPST
jgi:hypothetical protein